MNDLPKLQLLLPHWIDHQTEHTDELRRWAERIRSAGREDVADKLLAVADSLQQAGDQLVSLLNQIGAKAESKEKM